MINLNNHIMKKKILSNEEIIKMIDLYSNHDKTIYDLSKIFLTGTRNVSNILKENNVRVKDRSDNKTHGLTDELSKFKLITIKHPDPNKHYILECKITNKIFTDVNNKTGVLTDHLKSLIPNIIVPDTIYEKKKYELVHGKKWYIDYFNLIERSNKQTRKCGLCNWETTDILNKTGCFEVHINNTHKMSIDNYLKIFPEEIHLHKKVIKNHKRNEDTENDDKMNPCKICGEKFYFITNSHLKKHGLTVREYKQKFNIGRVMSNYLIEPMITRTKQLNIDGKMSKKSLTRPELEIIDLLKDQGIDYRTSDRKILNGKEIDIVIDDLKLGIEFNGNVHHTEFFGGKDKNYHLNKTIEANKNGYKLIHVFSDEWFQNKDLIKNKLLHIIKKSKSIKIGARKCTIKEINSLVKDDFLNKYHIQGEDISSIKLGAFYNNNLIAVMTFKKHSNNRYELSRFATDHRYVIPGVGSKLLSHMIYSHNPSSIFSFADRRWTIDKDNNLYTSLGFKLVDILKPDYKYIMIKNRDEKRYHKFGFRKKILLKKYPTLLNNEMSEYDMIKVLGYDRIWDCGLFKYELTIKST